MASSNSNVELRGPISREVADILDAWSISRNITRSELVQEILAERCMQKAHEADLIYRASRGNPLRTEPAGR